MRRMLLLALSGSLLALGAPAVASAHHRAHGARAHHRHHRKTVVFKADSTPGTTTGEVPAGETAGTIASYEEGVLKITLADGSTVSGKVTEQTWISCGCPGHGGGPRPGGYWSHGGGPGYWPHGGGGPGHPGFYRGDDERFEESAPSSAGCGTSALLAGAKVKLAELRLSGEGAVWSFIDLAPSSLPSP
jgi:hypothetical protein